MNIYKIFDENRSILLTIKNRLLYITEKIMKKELRFANKQLHDTLINYFVQNYIGPILKPFHEHKNLRDI